jgi:hypothetical protein
MWVAGMEFLSNLIKKFWQLSPNRHLQQLIWNPCTICTEVNFWRCLINSLIFSKVWGLWSSYSLPCDLIKPHFSSYKQ